jgi:hypothetical protein
MTPKPEDAQSYTLPQNNGYVNSAFVNNEKSSSANLSNNTNGDIRHTPQPTQPSRPIIDFDDLLPHIGDFGRYQKILFLLMIPFAFFVAFVYFSQIFITLVPDEHWCAVPELENLNYTLDER